MVSYRQIPLQLNNMILSDLINIFTNPTYVRWLTGSLTFAASGSGGGGQSSSSTGNNSPGVQTHGQGASGGGASFSVSGLPMDTTGSAQAKQQQQQAAGGGGGSALQYSSHFAAPGMNVGLGSGGQGYNPASVHGPPLPGGGQPPPIMARHNRK